MAKDTISKLKKKADNLYSRLIRLSYAEDGGMVKCFTCDRWYHYKKIQNGHFVGRSNLPTRYYDRNCHPQCYGCNCMKKGNYDEYAVRLVRKYGAGILEELNEMKYMQQNKIADYEEMIKKFNEELKSYDI